MSRWSCRADGHGAMSGLPEGADGRDTFEAADYDTLVDGPIVAGDLKVYEFTRAASRTIS